MRSSVGLSMCVTVVAVSFLVTRWIISLTPGTAGYNYGNSGSSRNKLFTVIKSVEEVDEYPPFEGGAVGPESLAFDGKGEGPYVGLSDGRIVKWVNYHRRWIDFAFTSQSQAECVGDQEQTEHICGRPLGLRFHLESGDLYIADAYFGLVVVGPNGGLAHKVPLHEEGVTFGFVNGLDIDQTRGHVFFTESSTRFSRRSYFSAIVTADTTGRLLRYDIKAKRVSVLLTNLTFPNGVSLTKDAQSILLAESTNCRILRYWPPREEATAVQIDYNHNRDTAAGTGGKLEVFADNLLGYPDNIKRIEVDGEYEYYYWVGIYTRTTRLAQWALARPWVGEAIVGGRSIWLLKLITAIVRWRAVGMAVKLNDRGRVVEVLEDRSGKLNFISEVDEIRKDDKKGRSLMFGSVIMPCLSVYNTRLVNSES